MSLVAILFAVTATWLVGAAICAWLVRSDASAAPTAGAALALGAGYPIGVLVVAAWMFALGMLGVRASMPVALAPLIVAIGYIGWRMRGGGAMASLRGRLTATLSGNWLDPRERWIWIALVAWIAIRFALLALEITSRPPLPWEAWLHAGTRARVWHALGGPAAFVAEAQWWQSGGYLAGLAGGSPLTPGLDAWTAFSTGRFDDTLLHLPWLALLASQALLAYAALRSAGASPIAALAAAALVATVPLSNAHAALGGTGASALATFYLGAFVIAARASVSRSARDAALAIVLVAGMLAAGGGAGAAWALTLVPFAASRLPADTMRKTFGALVVAAVVAVIVVARNRLFVPAAVQDVPVPGIAALVQHVLLLGNWNVLAYGALALALLASRVWRANAWLAATTSVALGVVALVAFATTAAGRSLVGSTGTIGHAATVFAPVLAVWMALIAHAWWADRLPGTELRSAAPRNDAVA